MMFDVDDFEIHLTVKTDEIQRFRETCASYGMKPIVLELQKEYTNVIVMTDVMTSSKFTGTYQDADVEASFQSMKLTLAGFKVVRTKIEASPKCRLNYLYLESHLRVITTIKRFYYLGKIANNHGAHRSRNIYKKIDDDKFYIMLTKREYEYDLNSFIEYSIDPLKSDLDYHGFVYDKLEVEKVIYDSNRDHDKAWIGD